MDNPVRTFPDSQYRQITIGGEGGAIVAEHNGVVIGRFDFDIVEDENSCNDMLTNCHIDPNYQRSGIGIEMIKLAEEWYDDFCIVDHFSSEGAAFITFCRDNVFVKQHSKIKDDRY